MKLSEHYGHEVVIDRITWHPMFAEEVLGYYLACLDCKQDLMKEQATE